MLQMYKLVNGAEPNPYQKMCIQEHFAGHSDQVIEFSDFIIYAIDETLLQSTECLATIFRYFDKDGSGTITPTKIVAGLNFKQEMNLKMAEAMMGEI